MLKWFAPAVLLCLTVPLVSQQRFVLPDVGTRNPWPQVADYSYAPFSGIIVAKWIRTQPDGSQRVTLSTRRVARDKSGRVFLEHALFPNGDAEPNALSRHRADSYHDPNTGQLLVCNPNTKKCVSYKEDPSNINRRAYHYSYVELPFSKTLARGITQKDDSLGKGTIEGHACDQTRITTVFPAGYKGIQKPATAVNELCYAPQIGIDLLLRRVDPFSASDITFTVTNLQLGDPDPRLFSPPSNFTIEDHHR